MPVYNWNSKHRSSNVLSYPSSAFRKREQTIKAILALDWNNVKNVYERSHIFIHDDICIMVKFRRLPFSVRLKLWKYIHVSLYTLGGNFQDVLISHRDRSGMYHPQEHFDISWEDIIRNIA